MKRTRSARPARSLLAVAGFLAVWVGTLRAVRRREHRARKHALPPVPDDHAP